MKRLSLVLCAFVVVALPAVTGASTTPDTSSAVVDVVECPAPEAVSPAEVEPTLEESIFETLEPAATSMPGRCQIGCDICYHDWECDGSSCGNPDTCTGGVEIE